MSQSNFDYRADYFRKHKGLFGMGLYFCSYCGKPITKKNAHVDHIIPKSKNEWMLNRSFNTTIACPKCNLKKSDKVDYRIVQGYASKIGGSVVGNTFGLGAKAVGLGAKASKNLVRGTLYTTSHLLKATLNRLRLTVGHLLSSTLRLAYGVISGTIRGLFRTLFRNPLIAIVVLTLLYLKFRS